MATFVLVHGAFQGGWVWNEVAKILGTYGHETHAPTLSGCGYLSDGLRQGIDLHTHIQDVSNYLHYHDLRDVILVAHSYSGMVCAAAALRAPLLVRRVIFVDAVIPDSNSSFAHMAGEAFNAMLDCHRVGGWKVKPWPLNAFGVPEHTSSWFGVRLREFPEAAFTTPFPGEFEANAMDAAYIDCSKTANRFISSMAEKAAGLGWPLSRLDSDHSPMTTNPAGLAAHLHEAAGNHVRHADE